MTLNVTTNGGLFVKKVGLLKLNDLTYSTKGHVGFDKCRAETSDGATLFFTLSLQVEKNVNRGWLEKFSWW